MTQPRRFLFLASLALLAAGALWSYWPQLTHRFLVPVGGDSAAHVSIAESIRAGTRTVTEYGYPPLSHAVFALAARAAGVPTVTAFAWLTPALLVSVALVCAGVTWRWLKSWPAALMAFALMAFAALQPFQTWQDGGFPDIVAASLFLPAGLWFLAEAVAAEGRACRRPLAGYGAVLLLIVATHHLTTLTFVGISLVYVAVAAAAARLHRRPVPLAARVVGGGLILAGLAVLFLFPGQPALQLTKAALVFDRTFPFVHSLMGLDGPDALLPLTALPDAVGLLVCWGGVFGLGLLASDLRQARATKLLFWVWVLTLVALSQVPQLRFPVRFARELGVPLTILAAYAGVRLWALVRSREVRLAALLVLTLLAVQAVDVKAGKLAALPRFVEFTAADRQAADYLATKVQPGDCVAVVPENRYYPYFLPDGIRVLVYPLDGTLRQRADALPDPAAAAWFATCPFAVAGHRPGEADWPGRFQVAGFRPAASFGDADRGVTVFSTQGLPGAD